MTKSMYTRKKKRERRDKVRKIENDTCTKEKMYLVETTEITTI